MAHKQRSTKWAIQTTYSSGPTRYECPQVGETVSLDCLFTLDSPQGGEGFLSPCCCHVRCNVADRCPALPKGKCPLTRGRGDVLNEMRISVLEGERSLLLEDDGTVSEVGDVRPDGYVIWFGQTNVSGDGNASEAPVG